jgi:hypothetical protein
MPARCVTQLTAMDTYEGEHAQESGVYPNAPNGAVSMANWLIPWDFEIDEPHSNVAISLMR